MQWADPCLQGLPKQATACWGYPYQRSKATSESKSQISSMSLIALTYGSFFLAALWLLSWHTLFTSHAPCLSLRRPCCVTQSCALLFTLLLCMSTSRHLWLCHVQPLCSILVFSYGPSFKVVLCSCPWQCPLGNIEFIIVSCLPQGLYSPPQPCTFGVALAVFGTLSHVKLALWLELRRLSPCRV